MRTILQKHRGRENKITSSSGQLVMNLLYLLFQIIEALYENDGPFAPFARYRTSLMKDCRLSFVRRKANGDL